MSLDAIRNSKARALRKLIYNTPIIDNHAHPLLKKSQLHKYPLLSIVSEAHGDALESSQTGLAFLRAVKELAQQLGCSQTWDAVSAAIDKERQDNYDEWIQRCVAGIACVLVDDGLDDEDAVEPYTHFDRFTPQRNKRIVRIEKVAARLIESLCLSQTNSDDAFEAFEIQFESAMQNAVEDAEVVGFKSVICYRTGLDISPKPDACNAAAEFSTIFAQRQAAKASKFTRVNHKCLNEYLIHLVAQYIRDGDSQHKKPIQFHTGLGDNDLTLTRSSPSHMQGFISRYPTVPIVLLHSGYPFVRETGYLAAMYANVYADIGEVFPFLGRDGQESVVRQILELCPWSKILWSTDGHWFPETYLLAVAQMREVFHTVLCYFVNKGDMSWTQATDLVRSVLFENSNKLYSLGLSLQIVAPELEREESTTQTEIQLLKTFLDGLNGNPRFLRLCWLDYTATLRSRVVPLRRTLSMLEGASDDDHLVFKVPRTTLGQLQNDALVSSVSPVGEYRVRPDLSSLRLGPRDGHIFAMCNLEDEDDGSPTDLCPRGILQQAVSKATNLGLDIMLGFEIEMVLLRQSDSKLNNSTGAPGHAWSSGKALDNEAMTLVLEDAVSKLDDAGVYVEMIHAESTGGQYEIVLPKAPVMEAVDTLVFARNLISSCAISHGFRMTLHPKPVPDRCGTAAHAHLSVATLEGVSDETIYEPFYAGILSHLQAICAFTLGNLVSYQRVQDGLWTGGTWVAWGTQNRETPLRKVEGSHWELRCMDGLANPYLAMAATIYAGVNGVAKNEKLLLGDCRKDTATLSAGERESLGVLGRLPSNIFEALVFLSNDKELGRLLGEDVIERYHAIKIAENTLLESIPAADLTAWVMDRY